MHAGVVSGGFASRGSRRLLGRTLEKYELGFQRYIVPDQEKRCPLGRRNDKSGTSLGASREV